MRIMLACCAGMSTSLVVSKMQEAAKQQGKDYKIWAVEQGQIEAEMGNFDVLLLGPQVRHIMRKVQKIMSIGILFRLLIRSMQMVYLVFLQ